MTSRRERVSLYIDLMRQAAKQATDYVSGMDQAAFDQDPKTQDAVIMKLLVIGELAAKVLDEDPEFAQKKQGIPWSMMKGMRNRMAHGYFELDLGVVWDTVNHAVPELVTALSDISK